MARNSEKANLMFNRWTQMKEDFVKGTGDRERRPFLASECRSLPDAERWRRDVIRDISRKITEIQNAGLGEARLRDMNDEINKHIREKGHWERQIRLLGGANYASASARLFDAESAELPGARGYRYFGAARDLPGVRELFAEAAAACAEPPRRSRAEIARNITPDYYGWRDEEDGALVAAEAVREAAWRAEGVSEWEAARAARREERMLSAGAAGAGTALALEVMEEDDEPQLSGAGGGGGGWGAPAAITSVGGLHVPTQGEIEALLVAKRKALLLARYTDAAGGK